MIPATRFNPSFQGFTFDWDVIIAHGPGCFDGATAAWSVWRKLPNDYRNYIGSKYGGFYSELNRKDDDEEEVQEANYVHPNSPAGAIRMQADGCPAVFVFIQPGKFVPEELVKEKRVLILDLDMGEALIPVVKASAHTLLCDHHDSTMNTIANNSNVLLNECRSKFATFVNTKKSESGASLAWRLSHSSEIPNFVNVVRIGDTWQWDEMPSAKYILDALYQKRAFRSFPSIENIFRTFNPSMESYAESGKLIFDYKESLAKSMAKHCNLAYVRTKDGTVYNVAYAPISILKSEVGSKMKFYAERRFKVPIHFSAAWTYYVDDKIIQASIRDPSEGLNLGEIARNIDGPNSKGGGHPQSASFSFSGIENFHKVFLREKPVVLDEVVVHSELEVQPVNVITTGTYHVNTTTTGTLNESVTTSVISTINESVVSEWLTAPVDIEAPPINDSIISTMKDDSISVAVISDN